jgi:hypothetical protein
MNGTKTYAALQQSVSAALQAHMESFRPDWDDLAQAAYDGFTKDLAEGDLVAELDTESDADEPELVFRIAVATDASTTTIKQTLPLSKLLLDLHDCDDDMLDALELSLSRFRDAIEGA